MKALLAIALTVLAVPPTALAVPRLELPGPIVAEAAGPEGAVVTYTARAVNASNGKPVPLSCDGSASALGELRASALFPLGTTRVSCVAGGAGEQVTGSFTVTVRDTLPPVIRGVPEPTTVEATGPDGAVVTFMLPTAVDAVDGTVRVVCTPPSGSRFPIGTTVIACTATDSRRNQAAASFPVTVRDTTPPNLLVPPPLALGATGPDGTPASDPRIQVFLSSARASDTVDGAPLVGADAPPVFPVGTTTVRFTAADRFGNVTVLTSSVEISPFVPPATVVPKPTAPTLLAPAHGARLSAPPVLRWKAVPGATYYNVQLWRNGRKILSRWPTRTQLALRASWTYAGRRYRLTPGRYRWYVWPGLGARADARYGALLGRRTFVIVRRR